MGLEAEQGLGAAGKGTDMRFGDPVWEKIFNQRTWGRYPSEEAVRFVKRAQAWGLPGGEALDIGAGLGACTWMLLREGLAVTAFEGAPAGLERIPETARSFGCAASPDLVLGDIMRPEGFLAGRGFALMLDHYAMYANPKADIARAMGVYYALLRPGGYFLGCCFGKDSTCYGKGRRVAEDEYADLPEGFLSGVGHVSYFDRSGFEDMFRKAGFVIRYAEAIRQEDRDGHLEKIVVCASKPGA
jgi:SAM-dependent methyltransferase